MSEIEIIRQEVAHDRIGSNPRFSNAGPSGGDFDRTSGKRLPMVRMYRIYASGVGTASAVASIIIPQNGIIGSVQWCSQGVSGSVATSMLAELSTSSVTTATQNDTPGNSISSFTADCYGISGGSMAHGLCHIGLGVPVRAGDRIYIHFLLSGGAPASFFVVATIAIAH